MLFRSSDLSGSDRASSNEDSTLGTSDGGGTVRRRHKKGLLTEEVEVVENTNNDKTAKHKKVRATALIPCLNDCILYFTIKEYT